MEFVYFVVTIGICLVCHMLYTREFHPVNLCFDVICIGILSVVAQKFIRLSNLPFHTGSNLVGDVYASPRAVVGIPYFHIMTITDVKDDKILRLTHYDPNEMVDPAEKNLFFKLSLVWGYSSTIASVTDESDIARLLHGCKLLHRGTENEMEVAKIKARVDELKDVSVIYGLVRSNCESIASYLRFASYQPGDQAFVSQGILLLLFVGRLKHLGILEYVLSNAHPFPAFGLIELVFLIVIFGWLMIPQFLMLHDDHHYANLTNAVWLFISVYFVVLFCIFRP